MPNRPDIPLQFPSGPECNSAVRAKRYSFAGSRIPGLLAPFAYLDFKSTETPKLYYTMGNKSRLYFFNEQIHHTLYILAFCADLVMNGINNISLGEFIHYCLPSF